MNNYEVAEAGVLLSSRLLDIKGLNIDFIEHKVFPNNDICAMFLKEKFLIIFNKEWIRKSSHLDIMLASFHEVRHAYQYLQIIKKSSTKYKEDETLIKRWRDEFISYNQPKSNNDLQYLQSDIEIDAIAFAALLTKKIFNINTIIPPEIRDEVSNKIEFIISNQYLQL